MEDNKIINLESLKYYNNKIVKYINDNILTPIYSDPNLDFESTSNNSNCYGYVGSLKNINVKGDLILIDSIAVYVGEDNTSLNLDVPVWCRLLKFIDGVDGSDGTWEIIYQSTESKTIGGIAPETLFSFKMKAINEQNKLIKSTDKIAIVYADSEDTEVLSGIQLGFKAIVNIGGGLQTQLTNNSIGVSNWAPAFVIGYLSMADELKNVVTIEDNQIISGAKNFTSHIGVNGKSYIRSNIDQGELKVCRPNTDDGFIIRTSGDKNADNIYQLQLLTTNGSSSYQYNFPKQNGDIVIYKELSYRELRNLKDNSQLTPGAVYRITDYVTTTTQSETKSANHLFDVIVFALNENTLCEDAKAIFHEGDTYFTDSDLSAWELKYCLDNDKTRFDWVDETNGKGVIYRMIDEKRNDCPYDFKNILFYNTVLTTNTTSDKYYYTFSYVVNGVLYDGTVEKQVTNCYDNSMGVYIESGKRKLNTNVFHNTSFGDKCYYNTFGDNCYSNTFGNNCYYNTFRDRCYSNTFGDYCQNNTFGNYCESNTFGVDCGGNTLGDRCTSNTFKKYCGENTLGDNCYGNTLENYSNRNTFGNHCRYNTIGEDGASNIFGDNCEGNTFGYGCMRNAFWDICSYNTFGDNCCGNTFGVECRGNTFGDNCCSNTFGNYCGGEEDLFGGGYIGYGGNTFGAECTSNTFGNYCQNNTFGVGCSFNIFEKNCYNIRFQDSDAYTFDSEGGRCVGTSTLLSNVQNCKLGQSCRNLLFYLTEGETENGVRNLNVSQGLLSTIISEQYGCLELLPIGVPVQSQEYEIKVAKNSNGEIKVYCEADLIS